MKQEPIIFKQGEENGIVIERDHFERSIFKSQYHQAINIFNRLWSKQKTLLPSKAQLSDQSGPQSHGMDNQFSNIITFCGDRGEGKSSCMSSFATMLIEKGVREKASNVFPQLAESESYEKIEMFDVVDPSFFDTDHNLLELLLGRMYSKAIEVRNRPNAECDGSMVHYARLLMEQFNTVNNDIAMIGQKDKVLESLAEISDLAASVHLKCDIERLFNYYLAMVDKKCLLICIDDLDLNISEGYKMAEMLRKYLICPQCIILISVKIAQMIDVVATAHKKEVKDTPIKWEQCQIMAQKYVTKLFPRDNRVPMPMASDICERRIKIAEIEESNDPLGLKDLTVKERVVQLIFQKTGYVFYNGQHISPIIPQNLRSLRHLLSTFEVLPDYRIDGKDDETGRNIFKDYFFNTWARRLADSDHMFAMQLADYTDMSTLNAFVIEHFAKRIKDAKIDLKSKESTSPSKERLIGFVVPDEEDDDDSMDEITLQKERVQLYLDITNRANTITNISLGDVMYVLWLISTITVDEGLQNLIFFIKTVYSMRLYECYNAISISADAVYPTNNDLSKIYIHKSDALYDHVNQLQRLLNGAYFSYPAGMFLSKRQDRKPIDFKNVRKLVNALDAELRKPEEARNDAYLEALQLCEYLALCIVRTTTSAEKEEDLGYNRIAQYPTYLGKFNNRANYAIFDFLNPFYAYTNVEYSYRRFDEILQRGNSLYEVAMEEEGSLLYQMTHNIRKGWYQDYDIHGLISDAIIRITDVQWAIHEELLRQRRTHRRGSEIEKIYYAYKDIQNLQIKLYPRLNIQGEKLIGNDTSHTMYFEFLRIIESFIEKYKEKDIEYAIDKVILQLSKPESSKASIWVKKEDIKQKIQDALRYKRFPKRGQHVVGLILGGLRKNYLIDTAIATDISKLFSPAQQYSKKEVLDKIDEVIAIYQKHATNNN